MGGDIVTALYNGGDLGVELAELVDASGHLVGGAIIEVLNGGGDVSYEGFSILDASIDISLLKIKSSKENTVN